MFNVSIITFVKGMKNALEQDGFKVGINRIIKHPNYTTYDDYDDYDMHILELKQNIVSFTDNMISPICLPVFGNHRSFMFLCQIYQISFVDKHYKGSVVIAGW